MSDKTELNYITGIAYWAAICKPNSMTGKHSVEVAGLSDEDVQLIQDLTIPGTEEVNVKHDEEKGYSVQLNSQFEMRPDWMPMSETEEALGYKRNRLVGMPQNETIIGNGSKIRVGFSTYQTQYQRKKYTKLGYRRARIIDWVAPPEKDDDPLMED